MAAAGGRGRAQGWLVAALAVSAVIGTLGVLATASDAPFDNPYATMQFVTGLAGVAVGGFIAHRRPRHPMGWLLILSGASAWASFAGAPGISWMIGHAPGQETLTRWLLRVAVAGWIVSRGVCLALVAQAFWVGFGRRAWERALLGVSVAAIATTAICQSVIFTPEFFAGRPPDAWQRRALDLQPWSEKVMLACAVVAIVALVVRTVAAEASERRRYQWFVLAVVTLLVPIFVETWNALLGSTRFDLSPYEGWASALLPVVLAIAIVRHGVFDIEVVIRRTTIYAVVTVVLLALYGLAVWIVTTVSDARTEVAALIGAGLVAVAFTYVRDVVQRTVGRRLFGNRDDAYATLAALGTRLEHAPVGDRALQAVTDTLCEQLKVPWATIDLSIDGADVRVARTGAVPAPDDRAHATFSLTHQGIALGRLAVGWRTAVEPFRPTETARLEDLARQTGVLAHNVALTEALRHSRAVLLNAREEERRRIRADLHDGLGPTLATVALGLGAAAERLRDEPELTVLLTDLEGELQSAIADIRNLVYALRPAALDDLGLVPALREHAEALARRTAESPSPLAVDVDAPTELVPLPAAVEVAAYRVALEALTNVARHSRATRCRVWIRADDGLQVVIEDDGVGIDEAADGAGVGLASMRERVEELGGRLRVGPGSPRGTTVDAWLPLPAPAVPV